MAEEKEEVSKVDESADTKSTEQSVSTTKVKEYRRDSVKATRGTLDKF